MTQFDAVCFDLDGTLCRSDQSLAEIHRETFERAGVEQFVSPEDVRAVPDDEVATAESAVEFYRNLFEAAVSRLADDPDSEDAPNPDEETLWALGEAAADVVDSRAVSWREGAETALEHARERYPVGLVTNGGEETQTAKLAQLGLTDAFDV
ncbi:MAG: HAD family hydrolase, partial [Halobaculum sp.]